MTFCISHVDSNEIKKLTCLRKYIALQTWIGAKGVLEFVDLRLKHVRYQKVQNLTLYLLFFKIFRLFPEGPLKYPCLSSLKWQNHKILSNFAKNWYFLTKFWQEVYFGDWNLIKFLENQKWENFPIFPDFPDFPRKMSFYPIFDQKAILAFKLRFTRYQNIYVKQIIFNQVPIPFKG